MFRPARMKQVSILVLKEDADAVAGRIAEIGLLHLADCASTDDWAGRLDPFATAETLRRLGLLDRRIRGLARELGAGELPRSARSVGQRMTPEEIDAWEGRIAGIETEVSGLILRRDSARQELEQLLAIASEARMVGALGPLAAGGRSPFLETAIGRLPRRRVPVLEAALARTPHLLVPLAVAEEEATVAAVSLKKDRAALDAALRDAGFSPLEPPPGPGAFAEALEGGIGEKIAAARAGLAAIGEEIAAAGRRHREALAELAERINCTRLLARARGAFRSTGSTCLIAGWVPADRAGRLVDAVREISGGRCSVEIRDPSEIPAVGAGRVKVPVLFRNPFFARPFELVTAAYGIPAYGSIDPTVFVAATFLLMFGVMFGDVGEGLLLILLGAVAARRLRDRLARIGALLLACGVSSLVFGLLYGSVFGLEGVIRPLWVRPMSDAAFFLKAAVVFGIAVVSLGIVLNIANALRSRDWVQGIFDRTGLLAGVIYWGGIGLVVRALLRGGRTPPAAVILAVGIPVALLFMKAPAARLLGKSARLFPDGAMTYAAETIVGLVEMFVGFVSHTLSFLRVAAFALAHAMLFMAVFSLADVIRGAAGGTVLAVLVIVAGNALIILLEGIIVTVQALRLEYYEFFGEFFSADGQRYEPVRLAE
ncbi:MAG: V-type ATPase 116kDa subunit family protein [bacterium]|nr:V-type ATPase 116kDa subunit family protein [bacterium]